MSVSRRISVSFTFVLLLVSSRFLRADTPCTLQVDVFDANTAYTPGVALPLAGHGAGDVGPLTTAAFDDAARHVTRAAADGVTLLGVRITLPATVTQPVKVRVDSDAPGTSPGSLFAIDDMRVTDRTALGGVIDTIGLVGPRSIVVPSVVVGSKRYAFLLYRSPRNFDGGPSTSSLPSRAVKLVATGPSCSETEALTVVRPLVVFVHGTAADNDAWLSFPLWKSSGNEVNAFAPGTLPTNASRVSFSWIWNATGGVAENAATVLPQLVDALRHWREETQTAATQADVVTHSFGGFVARQVVQTQPDSDPLNPKPHRSFRAAANWGHGSIHKLITLAATHRGAASANATAYLNANGRVEGFARSTGCQTGSYIDKGALRDQLVLSPALQALKQTRVPGHALAGSGRAVLDTTNTYRTAFTLLPFTDKSSGPYYAAANATRCALDGVANYMFNLDANSPPVTGSDGQNNCKVTPNYDLVVSERSSLGLMPDAASTTAAELGFVGTLNHGAIHDAYYGSAVMVQAVSDRIRFLLEQPTTSRFFTAFPAVESVPHSDTEQKFIDTYQASWLDAGTQCPAPVYDTNCPTYSELQVVPAQLRLEDATPTPLNVYGELGGDWVLAWAPGVGSSSRACTITLTSANPAIAEIQTNATTGAQVVVAKSVGQTSITVNVKNAGDVEVPVDVVSVGN